MTDKIAVEAEENTAKPVWTAPVIDVFDAKDVEGGTAVTGEAGLTS